LLDRVVIALAPSSAAPGWFYGIFLILIFAFVYPVLPPGGMVQAPPPEDPWVYALSVARHMALPLAAMFLSSIFISIYSWRTFFLIHASEDYVEMARAKGLPSSQIELRYVLRPTLPPIVTSFALMLIGLWGGAIILEQVFNWPGLGSLAFRAIGFRDTPVIIATVVIFAYLLALTVFLLDIVYAALDPRVKLGAGDERVHGRPRAAAALSLRGRGRADHRGPARRRRVGADRHSLRHCARALAGRGAVAAVSGQRAPGLGELVPQRRPAADPADPGGFRPGRGGAA
jgi:ABC-type proline/glycine betaine transport system permease subunit